MEDLLDLDAQPPDARRPTVCYDEKPYQLLAAVRPTQRARPGTRARQDHEYARQGTCNVLGLFCPHDGWRQHTVTERRTQQDFAHTMRALVDEHYPDADVIRVVLDNLNTHTPAALYATFAPAEARRLTQKLEFHYTPKHGSWLNMIEIEFSVLGRQCLKQRLPDRCAVQAVIDPWQVQRNRYHTSVDWRFTVHDARVRLADLYPSLS
jgi:transposase